MDSLVITKLRWLINIGTMTFTTPWGTYAYNRMPFGLINVGATFQCAMNSSFSHLLNKVIVVYLDDLIVFSKRCRNHLKYLRSVIQRCKEHGIPLNPKNFVFAVTEGKLLGHIMSKEGIKIDPERVKEIQQLGLPSNRTGVKSFFGKTNFLRRFVPDFAETTKHMVSLMSEKNIFKWSTEAIKAFDDIKKAIEKVPTLINPNYKKDFIIYCYALEHTVSGILLQKNDKGEEVPISFMSVPLKKHELNYPLVEKHAYAVVKVVKSFRFYILHSHSIFFIPTFAIKDVLTQQEIGMNNRETWIYRIQEFDLEIFPTKLVRGQGLCKPMSELDPNSDMPTVLFVSLRDSWFSDVAFYLSYGDCPPYLTPKERRNLRLKSTKSVIVDDILYKKGLDGAFLRCVDKEQQEKLLKRFHNEACGGHFSSMVMSFKILRNCYYWLGIFGDAYKWVTSCDKCKIFSGKP